MAQLTAIAGAVTDTAILPTRFTADYGLRHPVAAAAMAFVANSPRLPAAVCNAGAVGAFAAGPFPPAFIRHNLRGIREASSGPINLNLISVFATDDHIDLCLDERPDVVSFHWGHPPRQWIERLQGAEIRVWEQVGTPDAARRAVDDGVDLIIAQGAEAGGHCRGELPTFVAVPAIVDAAGGTPVLAAGGIVDGRGLAAALMLGADGVTIGTRLIASEEADVAPEYRRRIVASGAQDTVLTSLFGKEVPEFNPMRVLRNRIVSDWHDRQDDIDPAIEQPTIGTMTIGGESMEMRRFSSLLPAADAEGDFDQMAMCAGQGCAGIHDVRPAADIIANLSTDARDLLARWAS